MDRAGSYEGRDMKKYIGAVITGLGISLFAVRAPASQIVASDNGGTVSYQFNECGSGGSGQPFAYFRGYDCSVYLQQPVTPICTPTPPQQNPPSGNGDGDQTVPPGGGTTPVDTTPTIVVTTIVPLPNSAALAALGLAGTMVVRRLRPRPVPVG
jgi:hypothetical protein